MKQLESFPPCPRCCCSCTCRYPWINAAIQGLTILVLLTTLLLGAASKARLANCAMLAISTVLNIENIRTMAYLREYVTGDTLLRGKVFIAGAYVLVCSETQILCHRSKVGQAIGRQGGRA